jgi:hypothetical protein
VLVPHFFGGRNEALDRASKRAYNGRDGDGALSVVPWGRQSGATTEPICGLQALQRDGPRAQGVAGMKCSRGIHREIDGIADTRVGPLVTGTGFRCPRCHLMVVCGVTGYCATHQKWADVKDAMLASGLG